METPAVGEEPIQQTAKKSGLGKTNVNPIWLPPRTHHKFTDLGELIFDVPMGQTIMATLIPKKCFKAFRNIASKCIQLQSKK